MVCVEKYPTSPICANNVLDRALIYSLGTKITIQSFGADILISKFEFLQQVHVRRSSSIFAFSFINFSIQNMQWLFGKNYERNLIPDAGNAVFRFYFHIHR